MPASRIRNASGLARLLVLASLFALFALLIGLAGAQAQGLDQEKLEEGARLYQENCAVCHGPDGEGRIGATLAKDWPSIRPDLTIRSIIANGISGTVMPAWSQENGGPLNEEEIEALSYYIQSWQTGGPRELVATPSIQPRPPMAPVPGVEGDPDQGAALFDQNCAVCHGPNGEGRVGATLAKDWPSIRPDLSVKGIIANGVPGSVMPAWSMENGGPLNEGEINDLVAFILALPENQIVQVTAAVSTPARGEVSWLSGWLGVVVFLALFGVIVAVALIAQRRGS